MVGVDLLLDLVDVADCQTVQDVHEHDDHEEDEENEKDISEPMLELQVQVVHLPDEHHHRSHEGEPKVVKTGSFL